MIDTKAIINGSRLELARLFTEVENETPVAEKALDALCPITGKAYLIGITGAPGTGKSSLVSSLAKHIRMNLNATVAVVAVDPSSPFTGGAILGDRVRMRDLAGDPGVFIRSMASRGELGGLARTTAGVVQAFDAAGYKYILIETVGAGQSEVNIARLAHTTIVVEAPGLGDDIQAIKAGILEIADLLIINKADLPGADNTERALRANLDLGINPHLNHDAAHRINSVEMAESNKGWVPPILKTVAINDQGISEVVESLLQHRIYLNETGLWTRREKERLHNEVNHLLQKRLMERWRKQVPHQQYDAVLNKVYERLISPREAIDSLLIDSYN